MLNLFIDAATQAPQAQGSLWFILFYVAVFGLIFYFFGIRPNKKKQKEEQKLRESLQVGDEVITIGGIYGRIISLKEDTIVIESVSDKCKLTISRWALQQNLTVHDDAPAKK